MGADGGAVATPVDVQGFEEFTLLGECALVGLPVPACVRDVLGEVVLSFDFCRVFVEVALCVAVRGGRVEGDEVIVAQGFPPRADLGQVGLGRRCLSHVFSVRTGGRYGYRGKVFCCCARFRAAFVRVGSHASIAFPQGETTVAPRSEFGCADGHVAV